jgi:hypothetical protein
MMRKLTVITSLLIAASLLLAGCITIDTGGGFRSLRGNGDVISQERSVSGIDEVSLFGMGNVEITTGSTESLTIEAESNLMDYLTSDVVNGTLELKTRDFVNLHPTKNIVYHLKVKSLNGLEILGSGNIDLDQADTNTMHLTIAGSGDINISDLTANVLDVTIPGSGRVDVNGTATDQTINVAGSGKYFADNLSSQTANVNIAGSGDVRIWVTDTLDIRILGSGDINYYGSPTIHQTIVGSGKIVSLGQK